MRTYNWYISLCKRTAFYDIFFRMQYFYPEFRLTLAKKPEFYFFLGSGYIIMEKRHIVKWVLGINIIPNVIKNMNFDTNKKSLLWKVFFTHMFPHVLFIKNMIYFITSLWVDQKNNNLNHFATPHSHMGFLRLYFL